MSPKPLRKRSKRRFVPGERIWAPFSGSACPDDMFPGTVGSAPPGGSRVLVLFDDGDRELVDVTDCEHMDPADDPEAD